MKTLVIVSHPDIMESGSQLYFINSVKAFEDVTIHHLENTYADGNIDVEKEQLLLKQHDRILFQFPFYWYSSPPLLKKWQDDVLTDDFAYGKRGSALNGKEFGLILMVGVNESEYQAGGSELFSINELTKPFQAVAHKLGMTYLRPLPIFQFSYMTEDQKMDILIKYWQMLTMKNDYSLAAREAWLIDQLEKSIVRAPEQNNAEKIRYAISLIEDNRNAIDGLKMVLDDMRYS
ncbi:MAG: NAD(P)H-dependent oxidoreductase [Heyndrickxia sp.]